jgi:hypothetical protein
MAPAFGWGLFLADIADPIDDHLGLGGNVTCGQLDGGNNHVFEANSFTAIFADKVDVIVLMVTFIAGIPAHCILDAVIRGRNGMENPLFHKRL